MQVPQVREAAEPSCPGCSRAGRSCCARAAEGDGDRRVRARALDARRRVAVRAGRARQAVQVDRITDLQRLRERFEQFKRRDLYDMQLPRCSWTPSSLGAPGQAQGGCPWSPGASPKTASACWSHVMLGMREAHEDWLELGRDLIARRAGGADADRGRRRRRADQGDQGVLARLRPPALRRSPRAQPARQATRPRTRTHPRPTGRRWTTRPANATASDDSRRSSTSSTAAATPRRPMPDRRPGRAHSTPALPDPTPPPMAKHDLLEQSLGEIKIRTQVIGRCPGKTSS